MPSQDEVDNDVRLILSGGLLVDEIGPQMVEVIRTRVQAAPGDYLRRAEELLLGAGAPIPLDSDALLGPLLVLTREVAPDATRALAARLAARVDELGSGREGVRYDSDAVEQPTGEQLSALQLRRQRETLRHYLDP